MGTPYLYRKHTDFYFGRNCNCPESQFYMGSTRNSNTDLHLPQLIPLRHVMLLYPLMKRMGYGLSKRESVILTWGGLRGALGMTLALMVSYTPAIPEDVRSQVLFFTAGIVTLTLCVNATTTRWLLNKLGLINIPSARIILENKIQQTIRENSEKYLERLEKRDALEGTNWEKSDTIFFQSRRKLLIQQELMPCLQKFAYVY